MAAVAYVHERGVAHCSLGAGSLLLSTFSDGKAEQLVVKLDNFGFSQRLSLPSGVPAVHCLLVIASNLKEGQCRKVAWTGVVEWHNHWVALDGNSMNKWSEASRLRRRVP